MNRVTGKDGRAAVVGADNHAPLAKATVPDGHEVRTDAALKPRAEAACERHLAHVFRHWRGSPAMDRLRVLLARHLSEHSRP